jgi:hypothetical protein
MDATGPNGNKVTYYGRWGDMATRLWNLGPVWHSSASPVELFFRKKVHDQLHERGREPCFCSFTMCLTLWEWVFREADQRVGQRVGCLAIEFVKLLVKLLMKLYQTHHYFKVPLFQWQWVKVTTDRVTTDHQYRMTTVDPNNLGYIDEPFVLAKEVNQVFHVKTCPANWRKGKPTSQTISQSTTKFF